jgi:hypothetical protein
MRCCLKDTSAAAISAGMTHGTQPAAAMLQVLGACLAGRSACGHVPVLLVLGTSACAAGVLGALQLLRCLAHVGSCCQMVWQLQQLLHGLGSAAGPCERGGGAATRLSSGVLHRNMMLNT